MKLLVLILSSLFMIQTASASIFVAFKPDFCACKDGKPVSYGNCSSFCADKNTQGSEIFFAKLLIEENPSFNSVKAWCTKPNGKIICALKAIDDEGQMSMLDVDFFSNTSIKSDITVLNYDKAYVFTLMKTNTGAKSDSIQIIKFKE